MKKTEISKLLLIVKSTESKAFESNEENEEQFKNVCLFKARFAPKFSKTKTCCKVSAATLKATFVVSAL